MSVGDRWATGAFFVLELPTTATRAEIERAGSKWLGMLELGLARAQIYTTPVGPRARTPELVRAAMAELRDPARRLAHELWCLTDPSEVAPVTEPDDVEIGETGFDAMAELGWSRR